MKPTEVLDALVVGNFATINGHGDDTFRSSVTPEKMRDLWQRATAGWGDYVEDGDPVVLHDIPLTFQRGSAHLQVAYRGSSIVGLVLLPGAPTARFGQ